jgi:hypothetical protein
MKARIALAVLALTVASSLAEAKMLGQAGASPTVYRSGAFWRALLLRKPPPYWMGGTVWVPLAPYIQPKPTPVVHRPEPPPRPPGPVWRRIPDAYLAAARASPPAGPLWLKTKHGFRLEETDR